MGADEKSETEGLSGDQESVNATGLCSDSPRSTASAIHEHWRTININGLRETMATTAIEIAQNKERSLESRKRIAESTREFKKYSNEEKLAKWVSFLKGYQEAVDELTKRAKNAEKAFANMYQVLHNAPDPVSTLYQALMSQQKVTHLEGECQRLRKQLKEYDEEFNSLKNQDLTISRLKEKLKQLDKSNQETTVREVQAARGDWEIEQQKLEHSFRLHQEESARKIQALEEELAESQRTQTATQCKLYEMMQAHEKEAAARDAEIDMLSQDLERAQCREKSALLAAEEAKRKLNAAQARIDDADRAAVQETLVHLRADVGERQETIDRLTAKNGELEKFSEAAKAELTQLRENWNAELRVKEIQIAELQDALRQRPTIQQYNDLKGRLKLLQAVQYNAIDGDAGDVDQSLSPSLEGGQLEMMLLEKNKKLESDTTRMKVSLSDAEAEIRILTQNNQQSEDVIKDLRSLVSRLEDDIRRMRTTPALSQNEPTSLTHLISASGSGSSSGDTQKSTPPSRQNAMVDVIASQRDRLRARIVELEEDNSKNLRQIEDLMGDVAKIRQDNVKLYEKIRYLQDFRTTGNRQNDIESGIDDAESRYRKLYEDSVNPFTIFNRRERFRRISELSAPERIALNASQFFLSNKYLRLFLVFYMLLMHLLVFSTLYYVSAHSADCVEVLDLQRVEFEPAPAP